METLENTQQDSFSYILVELEGLAQIENTNIQNAFNKLKDAIQTIRDTKETLMRDNNTLKIGVVGQVKAGKSSFLNSLFFDGESILPKASTPMTAGLTVLEYNDSNEFQIEYYNKKEWRIFEVRADDYDRQINELKIQEPALASLPDENIAKMFNVDSELCAAKDLVSKCGDIAKGEIEDKAKTVSRPFSSVADLQSMLENYVGASGRYTPIVKCLTIIVKGTENQRISQGLSWCFFPQLCFKVFRQHRCRFSGFAYRQRGNRHCCVDCQQIRLCASGCRNAVPCQVGCSYQGLPREAAEAVSE